MTYNKAAFKSLLLHEATGRGTRPPPGIQSAIHSELCRGGVRALGTSEPLGTATAPLAGAAPGVLTSALLTPSAHAPGFVLSGPLVTTPTESQFCLQNSTTDLNIHSDL